MGPAHLTPNAAGRAEFASLGQVPVLPALHIVARCLFAVFVFFTCFTFLRPSPYEFAALPAMGLWLALGIRLTRSAVPFVVLLVIFTLSLLCALIPYLGEEDPTAYTLQSVYLSLTGIFFVMFFSGDTQSRMELALKAYLASCLFAALCGIIAYFVETGILYTMDGRAAGVFEDPNVLGSFLVLGFLYCLRDLLTGESRHPLLSVGAIAILLTGIFLSFSRGSWGATVLGALLMVGLTWMTSARRVRRRIRALALVSLAVLPVVGIGVLSIEGVAERFTDRAQLTKDYDEGETGRFGNQLRSIPMLMERPAGFGPLRFRLVFGLEPHNSYIGGFANGGWIGGLAFIGIALTSCFVGFRLCLMASPYQRLAQIAFPALLMFFLQAFQIDIDHWRHVYLLLGMVWGLEAARLRWVRSR